MDDAPNASLAILLKHLPDLIALREVDSVRINLGAVLVFLRRCGWETVARDLGDALEGLGRRVVVVVYGDDLVPARLLEGKDDMGT